MQFSLAAVLALAATSATATYVPSYNGTSIVAPYPHLPTGTGSPVVNGTAAPTVPAPTSTFSTMPFEGAASKQAGSVLAIVIAGGVAMVSLHEKHHQMTHMLMGYRCSNWLRLLIVDIRRRFTTSFSISICDGGDIGTLAL
jgi:hypothetical protein